MKATFNIMFFIQKGKVTANGRAPIFARLTVNGERVHFSTKLSIQPDRWDAKNYCTLGKTKDEKNINGFLDELKCSIQRHYFDLQAAGDVVSASKIKKMMFCTEEHRCVSVKEIFDRFIEDYTKQVQMNKAGVPTLSRYKMARQRVLEFSKEKYRVDDMPLADIDKRFIEQFFIWLRLEHGIANNTAVKYVNRFSTVYKLARDCGWVQGDPFHFVKLKMDKVDRGFLTNEEIQLMYKKKFVSERLEQIRDLFIFSCYTGLSFIDVAQLSEDNLKLWGDGHWWLNCHRQKTKVPFNVMLLDIPLQIIEKYKPKRRNGLLFHVPTNQKCNEYLKEIAALCGINKNLTFHMARHTFATTITLGNGVPIETVSKMLGHTNIKTTQIYARITDQKVGSDMEVLAAKINGASAVQLETSIKAKNRAKAAKDLHTLGVGVHLS